MPVPYALFGSTNNMENKTITQDTVNSITKKSNKCPLISLTPKLTGRQRASAPFDSCQKTKHGQLLPLVIVMFSI